MKYPFSSIGFVSCTFGLSNCQGTGFLIGPNFVLTSAHNLVDGNQKIKAKNIYFYPCVNEDIG